MHNIFDHTHIPQEARLYRILDEQELLTRRNCKEAIDHIISRIFAVVDTARHSDDSEQMRDSFFEACYLELMYDFSKFVQTLPDTGLSSNVPMLERSLARASAMLAWFCPQVESLAARHTALGGIQKLVYVVFTSALLYEIGCLEQERVIHLTNHFGHFLHRWDPLMGPMEGGSHFKIRYRTGWKSALKVPLTHCFARQLMPSIGLLWISDSPQALALWFALLTDATEAWMEYGLEFSWDAIDILMEEYLRYPQDIETIVAEETLWGEIFWDWLKNALHNKDILLNNDQAAVHMTEHGLVLDADIVYDTFNSYMQQSVNKVVIYQQFNHMGLVKLSGQDVKFNQYFSQYPQSQERAHVGSNMFSSGRQTSFLKKTMVNGLLVDPSHSLLDMDIPSSPHIAPIHAQSWLRTFLQRFGLGPSSSINDTMQL